MRNRTRAAGLALAGVAALVAVPASAQAAGQVNGRVAATAGLNVRSGSPTGVVIDVMPYNSVARLYCWVSGPAINGPWGTTSVWDAVDGYTTPWGENVVYGAGPHVFSSDAWLDTGGDTSKMLPHC
jgi:hypothetical protein